MSEEKILRKVIITAAITGAAPTPSMSEYLPASPQQIADDAVKAYEAGAAIAHVHAREEAEGKPTPSLEVFREILTSIKKRCDIIICVTTGGAGDHKERIAVVPEFKPELATLNCGSVSGTQIVAYEKLKDKLKYDWEHDHLNQEGFIFENTFKQMRERAHVTQKLLEVNDLKVHFPIKKGFFQRTVGYTRAVDGVSFSIPKGKTLALVGESGSGKSTIGKAILSLLPVTEGLIRFQDQDLAHLSPMALKPYRRKIQVVFQDPFSALNPRMTVGEIIREGMVSLGAGAKNRAQQNIKIRELLLKVELEAGHMHRYPHEFSGGQRQRIGIARALAVEPELIICDEPTSALDVSVRAQILKLLQKLQDESGVSYLFITHDLSIVPAIGDEIAVMKEGKIVEQGSVENVMNHPQHPYTQKLLESAPKLPI